MSWITTAIEDITHRLTYHPSTTDLVAQAHKDVRGILAKAASDALAVADAVAAGPTREISLALTALEEADHWFHAHIARNQPTTAVIPPLVVPAAAPVVAPAATAPVTAAVTTEAPAAVTTAAPATETATAVTPAATTTTTTTPAVVDPPVAPPA